MASEVKRSNEVLKELRKAAAAEQVISREVRHRAVYTWNFSE